MSYLRYLLLFLCVCGSMANAKGYAPAVAKNSTGFDIKFASNGTPLANMSNTASGVAVGATAALPLSSSVIIQAAATGAVTGASAAGAWGAAIGALGAVALAGLPVILDWMNSAGVKVASDGSLGSPDPNVCTVAPCYEYQASVSGYSSQFGSKPSAHGQLVVLLQNSSSTGYYQWSAGSIEPCQVVRRDEYGAVAGGTFSCAYSSRQIPAVSQPPVVPLSINEAVSKMTAPSPTQAQVQALIDLNFPPVVTPPNVTGSPRAYLGNTVQMFSPDEKKIVESWANLDYSQPGKVGVQIETKTTIEKAASTSTVTTVNSDGTTSTSSVFSPAQSVTTTTLNNGATQTTAVTAPNGSVTATTGPAPDAPPVPCGLPNSPPCKIDETGTKAEVSATEYSARLDPLESAQTAHVGKVGGVTDKPLFTGWSNLFSAPPLAECTVFELPAFKGASMGSLDPCPVVGGVRSVMAYLWAIGGLWLCIGMVNKAV